MFRSEEMKDQICKTLAYIEGYIHIQNKNGYSDINRECENFFCKFLNYLYDINLINLNSLKSNYPAIDLGDASSGLCIQVTSETSFSKITKTVESFYSNQLNSTYSELKILILGQKGNYRNKTIQIPDGKQLSIDELVIDFNYLSKIINSLNDTSKLQKIYDFVNHECYNFTTWERNYLNGITIQTPTIQDSYRNFTKSLGYREDDPYFLSICDDFSTVINTFATLLCNLNIRTRQILYAIIVRRIRTERNLFFNTTDARAIYFVPMDIINYLSISSKDFFNELRILESQNIYKSINETGYPYDSVSFIDEYGDDILFDITIYCDNYQKDIKDIIIGLMFEILD